MAGGQSDKPKQDTEPRRPEKGEHRELPFLTDDAEESQDDDQEKTKRMSKGASKLLRDQVRQGISEEPTKRVRLPEGRRPRAEHLEPTVEVDMPSSPILKGLIPGLDPFEEETMPCLISPEDLDPELPPGVEVDNEEVPTVRSALGVGAQDEPPQEPDKTDQMVALAPEPTAETMGFEEPTDRSPVPAETESPPDMPRTYHAVATPLLTAVQEQARDESKGGSGSIHKASVVELKSVKESTQPDHGAAEASQPVAIAGSRRVGMGLVVFIAFLCLGLGLGAGLVVVYLQGQSTPTNPDPVVTATAAVHGMSQEAMDHTKTMPPVASGDGGATSRAPGPPAPEQADAAPQQGADAQRASVEEPSKTNGLPDETRLPLSFKQGDDSPRIENAELLELLTKKMIKDRRLRFQIVGVAAQDELPSHGAVEILAIKRAENTLKIVRSLGISGRRFEVQKQVGPDQSTPGALLRVVRR